MITSGETRIMSGIALILMFLIRHEREKCKPDLHMIDLATIWQEDAAKALEGSPD